MRPYVRDYFFYLRRRVEDYPDPDQPVPKWSDLDHQAIALLLDEVERLHQFQRVAAPALEQHGVHVTLLADDEPLSTYAVPARRARDRSLDVLLVLGGVLAGAFARLIFDYVARF